MAAERKPMEMGTMEKSESFTVGDCLWCSGLFFLISFTTISSMLGGDADALDAAFLFPAFSPFVRGAAFLAIALMARRITSLLAHRKAMEVCAVLIAACALLRGLGFAGVAPGSGVLVPLLLLAVQNVAYAVLYLAWMEFYAQLDTRRCLICLCGAHLLSSLLSYGVFIAGSWLLVLAVAVCAPLATVAMLFQADWRTRDAVYRLGEVQKGAWHISARPVVLLAAFTLMNTFLRNSLEVGDKAFVLLGVCVAAAAVLAVALWRFDSLELKVLYEFAVPVLVAGAMLMMAGGSRAAIAAAFCSNIAFTLFAIFITVIFCAVSFRYGVSALWLLGIAQAALTAGSFLGSLLASWEESLPVSALAPTIALLVVGLVALSMLLVSDRDFETTWGVRATDGDGSLAEATEEEQLGRRCAKVARRYGLTRREEEILELMMRGRTLAAIGEELYVAESTMKTHSRHIYRKVGVANRQELQEAVESYPL